MAPPIPLPPTGPTSPPGGGNRGVVPLPATPSPVVVARALSLGAGANLVTWPGEDVAPWNVIITSATNVIAIYSYDATTREWRRYSPRLFPVGNTLSMLRKGEAYWIVASGPAELAVGR